MSRFDRALLAGIIGFFSLALVALFYIVTLEEEGDNPGHIKCYSDGNLIFEGDSTGRISRYEGWSFRDAKTRAIVRVTGTCMIELKRSAQ